MGREELVRGVEEQVVEFGAEPSTGGHAEVAPDALELRIERAPPARLVDLDVAAVDLPGVAHSFVEQRAVAKVVARRAAVSHRKRAICGGSGSGIGPTPSTSIWRFLEAAVRRVANFPTA
jgi:hypothetical protein